MSIVTYEGALRLTDRGAWSKLTEEDRLSVLQTIENESAAEVGRPARAVEGKWLYVGDDGIELGCYHPGDQIIYVNSSQLAEGSLYGDNPDKMVETVLHEGRHAFQHDVAGGRAPCDDLMAARAWADNLAPGGYITFQENPRAYYDQPVETDARSFASSRLSQMQGERAVLVERDAWEAARRGLGEKDGPGSALDAGDGHDGARGAFEAMREGAGERSSVAQRCTHGPRML